MPLGGRGVLKRRVIAPVAIEALLELSEPIQ
jgi:hypothetical protein